MRKVFNHTLEPPAEFNSSSDDSFVRNTLLIQLGYTLRLYQDDFPDDLQGPLDVLRGILTIPIAFSTMARVYLNNTTTKNITNAPLPAELETTVSGAHATFRVIAAL